MRLNALLQFRFVGSDKEYMKTQFGILLFAVGLLAGSASFAAGGADFAPILTGGLTYYSGGSKSLVGSSEKFLSLTGEQTERHLRLTAAADFGLSSGTATIGSDEPTYSMFSTALAAGAFFFPFKESKFQPFFGTKGVFGLQRFSMANPPTGLSESTQGFHYGYEVAIGIDVRFKKGGKGGGLRLYGAVRKVSGGVAGQTGFDLSGFRFGGGIMF